MPKPVRHRILRSCTFVDDAELEGLVVKVAKNATELEEAARLLHHCYLQRGLVAPHPSGLRITPHLLLPSTTTFVAKRGDKVVGSLSLVVDSPLGFPVEVVYPQETSDLRAQGRKLAEVAALCVGEDERRTGVWFLLDKLMWQCASILNVDDLLIAVHPRAGDFYRSTLVFRRVGPVTHYPGLNKNARAVLMRLDLRTFEAQMRVAFRGQPKDNRNWYHLYFERRHPQIQCPATGELQEIQSQRRQFAADLIAARPQVLAGWSDRQARELFAMLSGNCPLERPRLINDQLPNRISVLLRA